MDRQPEQPTSRMTFKSGYVESYVRTAFLRYERRQKMINIETFVCMWECSNELTQLGLFLQEPVSNILLPPVLVCHAVKVATMVDLLRLQKSLETEWIIY